MGSDGCARSGVKKNRKKQNEESQEKCIRELRCRDDMGSLDKCDSAKRELCACSMQGDC